MADDKTSAPASLRVYRYRAGAETVEAVLGWLDGRPVRVIREGTPVRPQSG